METTGKLVDVTADFKTLRRRLTFEVDNVSDEELNRLHGLSKLRIRAVKYCEGRSLTANGYFWKLINLIVEKQPGTSDVFLHDKYLYENRVYVYDDQGVFVYEISNEEPNELGLIRRMVNDDWEYWVDSEMRVTLSNETTGEPLISKATGEPITSRIFWKIKGTHQMDSAEMSRIIDSVVMDAKALGIETLPPAEVERLLSEWEMREGG